MKRRPPKQTRGARLVEKILSVTITQLAEVGLERLSIPEIARLSGANKTSLYRRWATKEELVRDALAAGVAQVRLTEPTGDLRRDLVTLGKRMATFIGSPLGRALLRIVFAEGDHSELRAIVRGTYAGGTAASPIDLLIAAWPEHARARRAQLELAIFAIAGAIIHRAFVEHQAPTPAFVERLVALILDGLDPGPTRRRHRQSNP